MEDIDITDFMIQNSIEDIITHFEHLKEKGYNRFYFDADNGEIWVYEKKNVISINQLGK